MAQALAAYTRYVEQFPRPIDTAVETRFKIAGMHQAAHDEPRYHQELQQIVRIDAEAGAERTNRTRTVAARSALVLSEQLYRQFAEVQLRQPFEASLAEKKRRMDAALEAFGRLVDYEVGDVTAAATFYMAETYIGFSRSLMASERPAGLQAAELKEYELALEDEALPFEEQAIEVHEKNMELMRTGIYNAWIDKSLGKLAELDAGALCKRRAQQRLPRIHRAIRLQRADADAARARRRRRPWRRRHRPRRPSRQKSLRPPPRRRRRRRRSKTRP